MKLNLSIGQPLKRPTHEEVEVKRNAFLTLTLDGCWLHDSPKRDSKPVWTRWRPVPLWTLTLVVRLVASRFTDCAIPVYNHTNNNYSAFYGRLISLPESDYVDRPKAVDSNLHHLPPARHVCVKGNYVTRVPTRVGIAQAKSQEQPLLLRNVVSAVSSVLGRTQLDSVHLQK